VSPTPPASLSIGPLDSTASTLYITYVPLDSIPFMSTKLMVELLRRGKTGNDILKILDCVVGEAKLSSEARDVVLNANTGAAVAYNLGECPEF
jgi:hypothetical protein